MKAAKPRKPTRVEMIIGGWTVFFALIGIGTSIYLLFKLMIVFNAFIITGILTQL